MNGEYDKEFSAAEYNKAVKDFAKKKLEDSLPYPWCFAKDKAKCLETGRCQRDPNCGD